MKIVPSWFRIHLSTAVVLMLAASVILELNVKRSEDPYDSEYPTNAYGWPMAFYVKDIRDFEITISGPDVIESTPVPAKMDIKNLVIDVVTAAILLIVVGVVLEKRIAVLQRLKVRDS